MGNPLAAGQPQPMPGGADPDANVSPDQLADAHKYADLMLGELLDLVKKPQGTLTKQDVFQGAASLLGKGLFNDPKQRMALVASLTQLPDDEMALRQALGQEIGQLAALKDRLDAHPAAQG